MLPIGKVFRTGVTAALLLAGAVTAAQGQVPGGGTSFGGASRGMVVITGSVVCVGCSVEEVRKAQPNEHKLYQLSHKQRQVVMKVTAVNESAMFEALAWPPKLGVRGPDRLLDRLSAEENLFKEITIVGILRSSRILDVFEVTISG